MTEYGLDVDAGQIVHWLKDDAAAGRRRKLYVRATREYSADPVENPEENGLGDDEEAAVLATTGILEVRPRDVEHVWVLQIRIEDVVGPHVPEDESVPEDAEEIDLDAFLVDFILPDRGTVDVTVKAETVAAKRAFDRLLNEIITDRHGR